MINSMTDVEIEANKQVIKSLLECCDNIRAIKNVKYGKTENLQFDICKKAFNYSVEVFGSEKIAKDIFWELRGLQFD